MAVFTPVRALSPVRESVPGRISNPVRGESPTVFIPSTHWVYDFLDRLEAKRITPVVLAGTKPMTRADIARHLDQVAAKRDLLSKTENDQLEFLLFEFQEHTTAPSSHKTRLKKITEARRIDPWLPDFIYPQGRHLLEIREGALSLNWDPIFYRGRLFANDDTLADQERVNIDTNGFLLWGTVGPYVGFYTDVRDTREWGTRAYPAGNTSGEGLGFVQGNARQIYHDETVAYLLFRKNYFHLQFGKDSNRWGPGDRGQLFLSDYATSYDQLKLQLVFERLKFTYLLAWLKHYTPVYFAGERIDKMLAAHRLEFAPFRFLDIGLHSSVVYAGRSFEPGYANPVMFFRSAEHYLGSPDNAAMGLDVELKALKNTKIYGELFLDDLTTGKIGTGFYGNKVGYTLGALYVDVLHIPNLDLRAEYTTIRPFTYSHNDSATAYAHFSTTLGHWIGPNADNLLVQLDYRLSRRAKFALFYENNRYGANTTELNVGRNIFRPRNFMTDPLTLRTLDGVLHQRQSVGLRGDYEFVRNGFLELAFSSSATKIDQPTDGIFSVARSEIFVGFRLNY